MKISTLLNETIRDPAVKDLLKFQTELLDAGFDDVKLIVLDGVHLEKTKQLFVDIKQSGPCDSHGLNADGHILCVINMPDGLYLIDPVSCVTFKTAKHTFEFYDKTGRRT